MMLDRLNEDEYGDKVEIEDDDFSSSNFISLLKSEKAKTLTAEFNQVFDSIESLCLSYPLLILNKQKIVEKLL